MIVLSQLLKNFEEVLPYPDYDRVDFIQLNQIMYAMNNLFQFFSSFGPVFPSLREHDAPTRELYSKLQEDIRQLLIYFPVNRTTAVYCHEKWIQERDKPDCVQYWKQAEQLYNYLHFYELYTQMDRLRKRLQTLSDASTLCTTDNDRHVLAKRLNECTENFKKLALWFEETNQKSFRFDWLQEMDQNLFCSTYSELEGLLPVTHKQMISAIMQQWQASTQIDPDVMYNDKSTLYFINTQDQLEWFLSMFLENAGESVEFVDDQYSHQDVNEQRGFWIGLRAYAETWIQPCLAMMSITDIPEKLQKQVATYQMVYAHLQKRIPNFKSSKPRNSLYF